MVGKEPALGKFKLWLYIVRTKEGEDMAKTEFLTGNEAIAQAVWEAGVRVATSYPGSPTAQLLEALARQEGLHCEWSTSEKVALEVAAGASLAGARSVVVMKHVGINICADPLMTFAYTKINGGFVLVVGDDPGMHSSQNEQDSRCWGPFGFMPILEPSDAATAHAMTKQAFELSEWYQTPVMLRLFDKTAHMGGQVTVGPRQEPAVKGFTPDPNEYYMVPPFSIYRRQRLEERMGGLAEYSENSSLHEEFPGTGDIAVLAAGHLALYTRELAPEVPLFRIGMVYPLPVERIRVFASRFRKVVVIEELLPFIEKDLRAAGINNLEGKAHFKTYGEITPEIIHQALLAAGLDLDPLPVAAQLPAPVPRTPMMCAGCPHRPVIRILKDLKITAHGDIGCYLMGSYQPFEVFVSSISMGASLGLAMGMEKVQAADGAHPPNVAVIGDSTFVHSALPALVNASYNGHVAKVLILDNRATSMTGGQENPSTGKDVRGGQHQSFDYPGFCRVAGVSDVVEIDQFDYDQAKKVLKEKLEQPDHSVVLIATRPCALKYKIKEPHFYVDPDICIGCRTCISVSCPPISMQQYAHKPADKLNSFIDENGCVGCSVCAQVCPVHAIKRSEPGQQVDVPRPVGMPAEEGAGS